MNFKVKDSDRLDLMKHLINYGKVDESQQNTGMLTPRLEYSAVAADGKTYGIIKECNKYYIKVAPPKDTELLAEDFDYIGGFMNKKENEYTSYPMASKQFELKMLSLKESHSVTNKEQIVLKEDEEASDWQVNETREMRGEINRFKQLMENMNIILNEDKNAVVNTNKVPEAPASHPSNKKVNTPFTDTAVAKGDKDFTKTQSNPKEAGAPFEKDVNVTSKDMQSDKKPTENTDATYTEKVKYAPENSVADKNPSGGKVVKLGEGRVIRITEEQLNNVKKNVLAWNKNKDYMDTSKGTEIGSSAPFTDELGQESNQTEANTEPIHEETVAHLAQNQNTPNNETGHEGDTAPFDEKVNEASSDDAARKAAMKDMDDEKPNTSCDDDDENCYSPKKMKQWRKDRLERNGVKVDDCKQHGVNEEIVEPVDVAGMEMDDDTVPFPEVEDDYVYSDGTDNGYEYTGEHDVTYPGADNEYDDYFNDVTFEDRINSVVDHVIRENLDVFGKHPAYRKVPMTTPPNKETAPNGAKDWNDTSVSSEEPFGSKIGSSAPFDEKVMNVLVDAVMKKLNFQEKA